MKIGLFPVTDLIVSHTDCPHKIWGSFMSRIIADSAVQRTKVNQVLGDALALCSVTEER